MAEQLAGLKNGTGKNVRCNYASLLAHRAVGNGVEYSLSDSIQNYDIILIRVSHSSAGLLQNTIITIPQLISVSSTAANYFAGRQQCADAIFSDYQCGFTANNKFKVGYVYNNSASYQLYMAIIGINLWLTNN